MTAVTHSTGQADPKDLRTAEPAARLPHLPSKSPERRRTPRWRLDLPLALVDPPSQLVVRCWSVDIGLGGAWVVAPARSHFRAHFQIGQRWQFHLGRADRQPPQARPSQPLRGECTVVRVQPVLVNGSVCKAIALQFRRPLNGLLKTGLIESDAETGPEASWSPDPGRARAVQRAVER